MFEYLLFKGEEFEKISGKIFEHSAHDSMRANIKTGVVTWFSQYDENRNDKLSSFDNAIEFAMRVLHESYEKTVQQLLDFRSQNQVSVTYQSAEKREQVPFSLENWREKDFGHLTEIGRDYLASRYISQDVISFLEKQQFVSSDSKNNLLFKWYEFRPFGKQTVVGADVVGTYRKPVQQRIHYKDLTKEKLKRATFKGIATGSKHTGGFYLSSGLDFKTEQHLFVFEAPIEALSYIELYKDKLPKNCFFHAMAGMKWQSVEERVNEIKAAYPEDSKLNVILCVNNDYEAKNFVVKIEKNYITTPYNERKYELKTHLPKLSDGDWNEVLEYKVTGILASRELKKREYLEAQQIRKNLIDQQAVMEGGE